MDPTESGEPDSAIAMERVLLGWSLFLAYSVFIVFALLQFCQPEAAAFELFYMYVAIVSFGATSSQSAKTFRKVKCVATARVVRYIAAIVLVVASAVLVRELIILKAFFTLAAIGLLALLAIFVSVIQVRNEETDYTVLN